MSDQIADLRLTTARRQVSSRRHWPDYTTVWRWHFYAGVFCIPFVLVLSVTGTIFLFRPQIDAWEERDLDRLKSDREAISYADQVRSAQLETGGWLASLEVSSEPTTSPGYSSATRVIVEADSERLRSYVDPFDGNVLRVINEADRFTRVIRRLHGELLLGQRGSYLVELVASWTIMMVITGLVLWMPKRTRLAGVIYPRLTRTGKVFWKDLHSVVGVWSAGLIIFLIATGLPWSTFWGDYFKSIRRWTGTSVARQSWEGGHSNHASHSKPEPSSRPAWRKGGIDPANYDLQEIDLVAAYAKTLDWLPPVEVSPPSDGTSAWTIQSTTANRPYRQSMKFDAKLNLVISRETFADKHWIDQFVGQGIALHEGQRFTSARFGWLNQAFALLATSSLVMLCCSGLALWWRRRSKSADSGGALGLHPPATQLPADQKTHSRKRLSLVLAAATVLSIYLPLFGLSLAVVLIGDYLLMRAYPRASHWLGRIPSNTATSQ